MSSAVRTLTLACAAALSTAAIAQRLAPTAVNGGPLAPVPAVPRVELGQRLGATLPLQAPFTDSEGRAVRLGDEFTGRPVILVMGYYRCAQLCGLLMHELLEATQRSGLPRSAWRIVFASIDPGDAVADAAVRRRIAVDDLRLLNDNAASAPAPAIDMLVGSPASIEALTRAAGDVYERMPGTGPAGDGARFAHPSGIVIVTPQGRISRYLMGVSFDPRELRAALVEAGDGRVGTISDRIALLCAHLDPRVGRWSTAVLAGLRGVGIATMVLVGMLVWRRRARSPGGSS